MGAWIEMVKASGKITAESVAPYMGAWIEMANEYMETVTSFASLPTRERILEFFRNLGIIRIKPMNWILWQSIMLKKLYSWRMQI